MLEPEPDVGSQTGISNDQEWLLLLLMLSCPFTTKDAAVAAVPLPLPHVNPYSANVMGKAEVTCVLTDATLLPERQLIVLCAAGNRDQRGAWEGWAVNVYCLLFRVRGNVFGRPWLGLPRWSARVHLLNFPSMWEMALPFKSSGTCSKWPGREPR